MKKNLLLFLLLILSINSYAQNIYKEAYFIDNSNQKTDCLIKAIDWRNNPTEFEYKLSETAEAKTADIEAVQEFGIYQEAKYLRANVKIDRSSEVLSKLSEIKDPEFKEEDLFLKVLIQGKASLYEYLDKGLTRYFYEIDNSQVNNW